MSIVIDGGTPDSVVVGASSVDAGTLATNTGPLSIVWEGSDGSTWDLLRGPARASVAGIKGLGKPDSDDQVSTTAGKDGQRFRSVRLKPRTVFVPIRFKGDASTDVGGLQREFWRSLRIGRRGRFIVTHPDGQIRTLTARFSDDGNYAYKVNPYTVFTDAIGLTFVADDPWWYGEPVEVAYRLDPSGNVNFFGGGDPAVVNSGPPFYLSPSSGSQTYEISNPGDTDAWVTWGIGGDAAAFSVGVGTHLVAASVTIPAGSLLEINTDPLAQTALLDGVRVPFQNFTAVDFAPIPEGESQPLAISITGSGTVSARITPRYERAL